MTPAAEKLVAYPSKALMVERDLHDKPVLECINLGITFGGLHAVEDFNITVGRTEIAGLIGPNGAGKTTVFNLLTKVYQPTTGTTLIDGVDTLNMNTIQANHAGIARTFQNIRLFGNMSVLDNITAAMNPQIKYGLATSIMHLGKYGEEEAKARDKALDLLDIFDMRKFSDWKADSLPYGVQRRLEILRALATQPKVLLLDEPAAGMNPSETSDLLENIRYIRDTFKIAIILIEHDMSLVMNICEVVGVLNFGRIIAKGTPEEIQGNREVIEAYLGKAKENR